MATRVQAKQSLKYPENDPAPGRTVLLELDTDPAIQLVAMYVPNRGNDPGKTDRKRAFLDVWKRQIGSAGSKGSDRVLLGDLNVVPPTQHPRFLPQQQFEDAWFQYMCGPCGFYDAAQQHNRGGHESTWVAHTGEGYTYDHILPTRSLMSRVVEFRYDHATREAGLTDHSAMRLTLTIERKSVLPTHPLGQPAQRSLF